MDRKHVWFKTGQNIKRVENNFTILEGELPYGVYRPICDNQGNWSLECIGDKFVFNFEILNIEDKFINHVLKTWNNTSKNLGVMLTGVKGSGKSIVGKQLANAVNLPIILIECGENGDPGPVIDYLKTVDFECVFFFDEYEKGFKEGNEILTLMDGMYSDLSRKLFILTTNNCFVNDNLISRPSRIRYFKRFGNISSDFILEYLNNKLNNKDRIPEILSFVNQLKICTIDILKTIVEEFNLHDCDIEIIQEYMNLTKEIIKFQTYSVYSKDIGTMEDFIEACAKVGTSGENCYGEQRKNLSPTDLGIYPELITSNKRFKDLQTGDFIDNNNYKIEEIKGVYIRAFDSNNTECFYKILNPDSSNNLYDFVY